VANERAGLTEIGDTVPTTTGQLKKTGGGVPYPWVASSPVPSPPTIKLPPDGPENGTP
jgi:hypothetical protein